MNSMTTNTLVRTLQVDAAANLLAGFALAVAGGVLAAPLGLGTAWPLRLVGVGLVAYAVENLLVARSPSSGGLAGLIAVDLAFAAGLLALAVTNVTGAESWARWALAAIADVSLLFGIAKTVGRRAVAT